MSKMVKKTSMFLPIILLFQFLVVMEVSAYPGRMEYILNYLSQFEIQKYRVKDGDTLWTILKKLNLLKNNASLLQQKKYLSNLKPGELLSLYVTTADRRIEKIVRNVDGDTYVLCKIGPSWNYHKLQQPILPIKELVYGVIEDNLYNSSLRLGINPSVVLDLSDIFSSDVDFNTDLRRGDKFIVYLEKYAKNGKFCKTPHILAARMIVQGNVYDAYYFEIKKGAGSYYDKDGQSKERMFLKAPLHYRRISSYFTNRRFHPILKIYRPHYGIDYAAPRGTPVSALGDGIVKFVGWKRGFGKFIVIKHNSIYKTTYGHLCRFAKGIRAGVRVTKGQVIGYVGATGLATGPHLDFRFYKNGKPINFLKTKWPHSHSIPGRLLARFRKVQQKYYAMLEKGQKSLLAHLEK